MCGSASGWAKVSWLSLLAALAVHVAGWVTVHWMTYTTQDSVLQVNVGLWRQTSCTNADCLEFETEEEYVTVKFDAVRGLETVTFCILVFVTVLLSVYVFSQAARTRTVAIVCIVLCVLAGMLSVAGMIVWVLYVPTPFIASYSMGLTVIGFILAFVAATLLVPDLFRSTADPRPYTPPDRRGGMVEPLSYKNEAFSDGYGYRL